MHMQQCMCLCQFSFIPMLGDALVLVHWAGVCIPLHFCCVCLCTCTSACFELVLVSLCSKQSSVVHMYMYPSHLLQHHSGCISIVSRLLLPLFFLVSSVFYYISATGALLPFCTRAHGWAARICQPQEQSHLGAGCQWQKLLDVWGTQLPFSDAVVNGI